MKYLLCNTVKVIVLFFFLVSFPAVAVEFSLFGDSNIKKSNESQQFNLGGLNLTAEQEVSDSSSVIAEILFEFASHGYEANVTRFAITKKLTPSTEIYAGKFVKGLGLWHQTFHHGSLALDTISLPFFAGGLNEHHSFVAAHVVGAGISSRLGNFSYQLALANHPGMNSADVNSGRLRIDQLDRGSPANNFSTVFKLNYAFNWKSELSLLAHRRDVVELAPALDTGVPISGVEQGDPLFKQEQVGINFLYAGERFSSFLEYYVLTTTDNPSLNNTTLIPGNPIVAQPDSYDATLYYFQMGWKFNDELSASIRYEALEYELGNTFFQMLGVEKLTQNVFGMNYRFDESNALRFEFKQTDYDQQLNSITDQTIYSFQWFFLLL